MYRPSRYITLPSQLSEPISPVSELITDYCSIESVPETYVEKFSASFTQNLNLENCLRIRICLTAQEANLKNLQVLLTYYVALVRKANYTDRAIAACRRS
jgi:hypothetical protein